MTGNTNKKPVVHTTSGHILKTHTLSTFCHKNSIHYTNKQKLDRNSGHIRTSHFFVYFKHAGYIYIIYKYCILILSASIGKSRIKYSFIRGQLRDIFLCFVIGSILLSERKSFVHTKHNTLPDLEHISTHILDNIIPIFTFYSTAQQLIN